MDLEFFLGMTLVAPLLAAILVWTPGTVREYAHVVTFLVSCITLAGSLGLIHAVRFSRSRTTLVGLDFFLDALGLAIIVLVNIIVVVASCFIESWWRRNPKDPRKRTAVYSLFNIFHFTMLLVPSVANLVALWVGMELTTVASTALVAAGAGPRALEAAWKYVIITSTGIVFALLGTILLAASQEGNFPTLSWPELIHTDGFQKHLVVLSFAFVVVGFGTKAGLAPMHTWLPDAHGEAPYPVSALLSGVLLKAALYAILRFKTITDQALGDNGEFTNSVLLACGFLSLVVAIPHIIGKNPFKRVLAYHSLEHMGVITIGLGVGGAFATTGAILHVFNHGLTKSLVFLTHGAVVDSLTVADKNGTHIIKRDRTQERPNHNATGIEPPLQADPTGVLGAMPWTGRLLGLGGLALVGSPPFSIFLSELLVLWGIIDRVFTTESFGVYYWSALFVLMISSLFLIFAGLVRHLSILLLGAGSTTIPRERIRLVVPAGILLIITIVMGLTFQDFGPVPLRWLVTESARIVCGAEGC